MLMFIIRTGMPYYLLIIDGLSKGIPKQQILSVGNDIYSIGDKIKYAPIFGAYYLVIANYQKGQAFWKVVKDLENKSFVKLVLLVNTKELYDTALVKAEESKFNYSTYNSYKASKQDRNVYIVRLLKSYNKDIKLNQKIIDVIRKRLYGYSSEINGYLQQIAWVNNLDERTVKKIIPKKNTLTPASFGWMLYSGDVSLKEADALIYRYKYYPTALIESLKKYTDVLIKLLPYYLNGEYTDYNYIQFCENNKKLISSQFAARNYLATYKNLSAERLYKISSMINTCSKDRTESVFVLYKLVRLIKGVV